TTRAGGPSHRPTTYGRSSTRRWPRGRDNRELRRDGDSAGCEVGAGGQLFGHRPTERDHRLAPSRVEVADQRNDLRPTSRLHRTRVEDRDAGGLAALHRDREATVVEVGGVDAEPLRQATAPRAVFAV